VSLPHRCQINAQPCQSDEEVECARGKRVCVCVCVRVCVCVCVVVNLLFCDIAPPRGGFSSAEHAKFLHPSIYRPAVHTHTHTHTHTHARTHTHTHAAAATFYSFFSSDSPESSLPLALRSIKPSYFDRDSFLSQH